MLSRTKRIKRNEKKGNKKTDKSLRLLNQEIDNFIEFVKDKKQKLINEGNEIKWEFHNKFLPEKFIKQKKIEVKDNVTYLIIGMF